MGHEQKGATYLLNNLALELKTALTLSARPNVSAPDRRMASIRYNRALDQVIKLGYNPKYIYNADGSIDVAFFALEQGAEAMRMHNTQDELQEFIDWKNDPDSPVDFRALEDEGGVQHMYTHGDIDDRDIAEIEHILAKRDAAKIRPATGDPSDTWQDRGATFYKPESYYAGGIAKRERDWLLDPKTDILIYEDGEVLVDTHDAHKTRIRERIHTIGE